MAPPLSQSALSNAHDLAAKTSSPDAPLFPPSLISPEVLQLLPPHYTIRPLQRSDYSKGFLDVLRVLTSVGDVSEERWDERYEWMRKRNTEYFVLVVLDGQHSQSGGGAISSTPPEGARALGAWGAEQQQATAEQAARDGQTQTLGEGRIVGTGALVVERKFIHNLGMVGHIEDIAVAKDQQGKKLGLRIIQALDYVASQVGCYKSILDCSEANEGFYIKCGFKRAGLEMAHYYEAKK